MCAAISVCVCLCVCAVVNRLPIDLMHCFKHTSTFQNTTQVAFLTHNFRTAMLLRPGYPLTWLFRTPRIAPAPTIPKLATLAARALRMKVCAQVSVRGKGIYNAWTFCWMKPFIKPGKGHTFMRTHTCTLSCIASYTDRGHTRVRHRSSKPGHGFRRQGGRHLPLCL